MSVLYDCFHARNLTQSARTRYASILTYVIICLPGFNFQCRR